MLRVRKIGRHTDGIAQFGERERAERSSQHHLEQAIVELKDESEVCRGPLGRRSGAIVHERT